jgi:ATP-dependent DNA helicase RecG
MALKILSVLRRNPNATRKDIVAVTGLTDDGVKWNLRKLKAAGLLRRIGPDKGGHWEVVEGSGE